MRQYYVYQEGTSMAGPFPMDPAYITMLADDVFGVYLLASLSTEGELLVRYVGRGALRDRLADHCANRNCDAFYFRVLTSDVAGYFEECRLFHTYGKANFLDNKVHPGRPVGSDDFFTECQKLHCYSAFPS